MTIITGVGQADPAVLSLQTASGGSRHTDRHTDRQIPGDAHITTEHHDADADTGYDVHVLLSGTHSGCGSHKGMGEVCS